MFDLIRRVDRLMLLEVRQKASGADIRNVHGELGIPFLARLHE